MSSHFDQLTNVLRWPKELDLEDIGLPESKSKHLAYASLCLVGADIRVDPFDQESVELDELVQDLLVWLKLKHCHFVAEGDEEVVSKH